MKSTIIALAILALISLSCDSTDPYVHEPRFDKNVSTVFGFKTASQTLEGMAPDFTWKDSNGVLRSLSDLRGKIILVNLWATWCEPCLFEMPTLDDIAKDFSKDSVVVIGVSIDQEGDVYNRIVGYHRDRGLRFQVISDFGMDVYHAYMGTRTISIPQTFIVDRDGSLYVQLTGPQQYDEFATYIRELI